MFELHISMDNYIKPTKIADILVENGVECQIYENISTIVENGIGKVEYGYKISLFNIDSLLFKKLVWDPLVSNFGIICAHVKYNDIYTGCVLNWPGVFRNSLCNMN